MAGLLDLGGGEFLNQIFFFVLFFVFISFYPRLMTMQVIWNLERSAMSIEDMFSKGRHIALKKISKNPTSETRDSVSHFLNFFSIEPVSLDPYGIVKKIEHMSNLSEKRFKYFAKSVAPKMSEEERMDLVMTLAGAVSLNQIAKVVRHFVETIKKTKNLQLAMLLQMQLPMIEKMSKAMLKGTESFANGWPIGDTVGPLTAAHMIQGKKARDIEEDTIVAKKKIAGRNVHIIRAGGPGGRLGRLGKAVEKISKRSKIAKIITIDAAAKLEGEKTGSLAEGIGVAIGGIGVDRSYIENLATEKEIPLDTLVVKMSQEEAISPMKHEILNAIPKVLKKVEANIRETSEKGDIIIVGVGNSTGVGLTEKSIKETEDKIKKIADMMRRREEEEKRRRNSFFNKLAGTQIFNRKVGGF